MIDLRQYGPRLYAVLACVVALPVLGYALYHAGRSSGRIDARVTASKARTDTLMIERAAAVETVTVRHRVVVRDSLASARAVVALDSAVHATQRADSLAVVLSAITVRVRDTVAIVPAEVVARIESQSRALGIALSTVDTLRTEIRSRVSDAAALRAVIVADSSVIQSQGQTIRLLTAKGSPRCGWRCGAVLGLAAGVLTVHLVR